jgi:NitT/TauT family transport system ATP-binding protein
VTVQQGPAKLVIEKVSHTYASPNGTTQNVLRDVSLEVESGEFICLIGASGCGKTTLLRTIAGLVSPTEGFVSVNGQRITRPGGVVSVVFQQDSLWPWRSILANTRYGLEIKGVPIKEADERARTYLKLVGLAGYEAHYPHQLSGGMRQRVNLARALAVEPDILLMDEPFAALDAHTREMMQLELARIWQETKRTIVLVTHQIDEAVFLADRVVTMSSHPGIVRAVTTIELDRPRDIRTKRSDAFQQYVGEHWDMIEKDVVRGFRVGVLES